MQKKHRITFIPGQMIELYEKKGYTNNALIFPGSKGACTMPENRHLRFLLILFYFILGILGTYFIVQYLLKWLLPFVIAFAFAGILKKPTAFITRKLHLSRSLTSILLVIFVYGIVGTGVGLFISFLIGQFRAFSADLPNYLSALPEVLTALWEDLTALVQRLPESISEPILNSMESLITEAPLTTVNFGSLFGTVKTVAFSIPTILIFTIAMIISTFYVLKDFDRIMAFIAAQIPKRIRESTTRLKNHMVTTLGRWFRAMGIIILVTFTELTVGFLIIGLDYAVLLAVLVALIDALPVFGTGTVLIPWAIYLLLTGEISRGLYLAALYGIITIIRNIIEPRILGDHIGLNPLVMLICFYLGYMTLGLIGMFVLPVLLVCLDKLQEWGYIHLWHTPEPLPEEVVPVKKKRRSSEKKQ